MTGKQRAAEWLREKAKSVRRAELFDCKELMSEFGESCDGRWCADCYADLFERIAGRIDAERALPEGVEWPRFEDGELVKVGDEVEYKVETMRVYRATFDDDGWALWCSRDGIDGRLSGSYGERVKRPAPKVLDADGVPIEVGDTVYCDGDDEPIMVSNITDSIKVTLINSNASYYTVKPSRLSHERPDSWEKLEEDARKTACAYAHAPHDEDGFTTCDGCRFQKSESCSNEMTLDVLERAKKLAGIEEEARND